MPSLSLYQGEGGTQTHMEGEWQETDSAPQRAQPWRHYNLELWPPEPETSLWLKPPSSWYLSWWPKEANPTPEP